MAASQYLLPNEYAAYGVPNANPGLIMRASTLIDAYLQRTDGLIWVPDSTGQPGWMEAANPLQTLTATGPITPGTTVSVTVQGMHNFDDSILGAAVVLDRTNAAIAETCFVHAFAPNVLILDSVVQTHPGPVTIDVGMTIMEQTIMPTNRATTRLAMWPIARIISGMGRYGYGRRTDQMDGYFDDINLIAAFATFNSAPRWELFTTNYASYNPRTGDYWVPSGILLAKFTDCKFRYLGGWQRSGLPEQIKVACGAVVQSLMEAAMGPNVRRFDTGKVTIERFAATALDNDVKAMLRPYRATVLG